MSESFYNGLDAKAIELLMMFLTVLCIHSSSLALVWNLSGCRGSKSESEEEQESDQNEDEVDRTRTVDENKDENQSGRGIECKDECMKFSVYDRVAITFCSSQKTAAFGIPIVSSLYEDSEHLGIYLVPLLMYPPIQLIVDSLLVQPLSGRVAKWRESQKEEEEESSSKEKLEDKAVPSIVVGTVSTNEVGDGVESADHDVAPQV